MRYVFLLMAVLMLLIGCRQPETADIAAALTPTAPSTLSVPTVEAGTPEPSPTATATPTVTPTPLPTPTPTPTALPVELIGNPRNLQNAGPAPQAGAPCGFVDLFDYPLNPPNAANIAFGGQDFGIFRSRYDLYHAGEDWWPRRGQSSFGVPVYAIGHGQVTYAAPNGWGRDKGVLVVQHTFSDGHQVLSFYGHLDPPSVIFQAGQCVERGEQVGNIGRPRTGPHLHFEVRTHLPTEPGTGYWFEDPTLAGWLPPSETIWHSRVAASPGVIWAQSAVASPVAAVGTVGDRVILGIDDGRLVALDLASGRQLWLDERSDRRAAAVKDARQDILYVADRSGYIEAISLDFLLDETVDARSEIAPLWQSSVRLVSSSSLLPLPEGGVVVAGWQRTAALSATGRLLWDTEGIGRSFTWAPAGDQLIVSTTSGVPAIWSLSETGAEQWAPELGGSLAVQNDQVYIYGKEGVYWLKQDTRTTRRVLPLSERFLSIGQMMALPDGGLMIAHNDLADRRLIIFEADGTVRWERSYARQVGGEISFVTDDQRVYLVAQDQDDGTERLSIYDLDLRSGRLTLLFSSDTRSRFSGAANVSAAAGRLLVNVPSGKLVLLDPFEALTLASRAAPPATEGGQAGSG